MCGSGQVGGGGVGYCWLMEDVMIYVGWGRGKVRTVYCFGS